MLGGLWPLTDGIVRKPGGATGGLAADIFYVPQRPYVTIGSLQDQLVYPIERAGLPALLLLYVCELWVLVPTGAGAGAGWANW